MRKFNWTELTAGERSALLRRPALANDERLQASVAAIVARVRKEGDRALRELSEEIDGVKLESLRVTPEEFDKAARSLGEPEKAAIASAEANIRRFHEAQLTSPVRVETAPGVVCERLTRPIASVGLYVPAGSATVERICCLA